MKKHSKKFLSSSMVILIAFMAVLVLMLMLGLIDRNLFITMSVRMLMVLLALTVAGVVVITLAVEEKLK
jgi:glucan phosphoethanolaminetransferase (alkaline phosphatase superfamily)